MTPSPPILQARPRLRDDVIWLESDQGVYVRSAHAAMVLRGSSAYRLMSAVSPHLTGEHTVAELCDGLPQAQTAAVANLVSALLDRGMARDFQQEREAALPAEVVQRFAAQIAFLGHFVDDPLARFRQFRAGSVLLVGGGDALHALAGGLLANGLATVRLHAAAMDDPRCADLPEIADSFGARVKRVESADPAGSDLVLYCADDADLAEVRALAGRCRDAGVRFLPVVLRGRRAVLGPLCGPASGVCWVCAQLRLTANDPIDVAADTWRGIALGRVGAEPTMVTEVVARMMGNAAALEVFRALTGALPPETADAVVVQDTVTLESAGAALHAHPACPVCADRRPVADDETAEAATAVVADGDDEEHYRRLSALVDSAVGAFNTFGDDELRQSPLPTARLRVGPPTALAGGVREFVAFDVETVLRARLGALRTALGYYADRLAAAETRHGVLDAPIVEPSALDTWCGLAVPGAGTSGGWIRGTSMLTGEDRYVPAAAVFPHTQANRAGLYARTAAGIGVGPDRNTAAMGGLRSALAYRALDALLRGEVPVAALDPAELGGVDRLAFLRDCLGHLGHQPVLRLVDGAGPVPVVLARLADRPGWHIGIGETRAGAVGQALRELLGATQYTADHGSEPDLGDSLFPGLPETIDPDHDAPPERGPADRSTLLAAAGDAVCVATTPKDVAGVGSYLVCRVLLHR